MNSFNQRVLVIDDNRAIHGDFLKVLTRKEKDSRSIDAAEEELFGEASDEADCAVDFQVDSAYQGQEGLGMVQKAVSKDEPYAVAFVDIRMPPGWDGVETTLKLWEVDADLQIVICTAYSDYSWGEMQRKLGQSDRLVILKKPFDRIEVAQLASSLARKWQLLKESRRKLGDLEEMIRARTAQVVQEQEKFKSIFEHSPDGIFQTSPDGKLICANRALAVIYGSATPEELLAQLPDLGAKVYVEPGRRAEWLRRMEREKIVREFESEIRCRDGSRKWISVTASRITRPDGSLVCYQGFVTDITAQRKAEEERRLMEAHLQQAQKLESVGQLAAGIAHEINTPIQYIGDNIRFVEESFAKVNHLLADYHLLALAARSSTVTPALLDSVETACGQADVDYLGREIPLAVRQSLDGVEHVASIVRAMKEFSHPGKAEKTLTDLNHAIQTTVLVARNEWKYVANLVTDLAPDLPLVSCIPGDFNQVILNLIVNASHAIADVIKNMDKTKGTIKIITRKEAGSVRIDVSDTGAGIREEIRHRIFEPFFTTKEIGKGTGQGLAIARSTIVTKHGGTLTFESAVGQGSTFTVRLPIEAPRPAAPVPVCN